MRENVALGIDVGSTTVKLVVASPGGEILAHHYVRANGQPRETLLATARLVDDAFPDAQVVAAGLTGSGGGAVAPILGGLHTNELVAQTRAVGAFHPAARTVIEIGGQDSKFLSVAWDEASGHLTLVDFAMNALCAAGTGSFLDQQAERLGIRIDEEFARLALESRHPARVAGRCTVFAKSDMIHLQQEGCLLPDILAGLCLALGAGQLIQRNGFGRRTNLVLAIVAAAFVFAFLVWAAAGKSLNLAGLLNTALSKAVPLTLGAMSGILAERAGIINIAIEGMMLMGAMVGALMGSVFGNLWAGVFFGVLSGALLGLVHGWLSIKYKTNQVISGTAINIFATGLTSYVSARFMQHYQELNNPGTFGSWEIPVLSRIPFFGPILFDNNMFVYAMFIFLFALQIGLFYTRWGLRHRAVGEHPRAADTLGINVFRTRYVAAVLSGAMAGFAGAYFTLGSVGRFDEMMTAGRGFISLAAMIFGNWMPFGSFGAGLLFGFADSLASKLAILGVKIPSQFLLMAPYLVTMVVLAGVVGRGHAPAAEGEAYEKEG
jgi:simple sugar transport system permease protein